MAVGMICTCGARFSVDEIFAGREIVCPECQSNLRVPSSGAPVARTSVLALLSVVLALAGALTVIGSVAAAVLGAVAALRIARNRKQLSGMTFAAAGIVLGIGFTLLTTMALAGGYLTDLRGRYRDVMFADQLDLPAALDVVRQDRGFSIRRPTADWGIAKRNRVDDTFLDSLRLGKDPDLLLVQPTRMLFVDVRKETRSSAATVEKLDKRYREALKPVQEVEPQFNRRMGQFGGGWPGLKDPADPRDPEDEPELPPEPKKGGWKVSLTGSSGERPVTLRDGKDEPVANGTGYESRLELNVGKSWTMILRHYRKGDTVYVVRAYTLQGNFKTAEAELRQCLETFRLLP
jgi:hypothetical protein